MTQFARPQLKQLAGKLDAARVHVRERDGRKLDYIEGWFAISEANRIFGFAGWDREMMQFERVFERSRNDGIACGYLARVRIRVRAGQGHIVREGTGFGEAHAKLPGEAHERALKAAETDATKRALATFGNRFGLCLYDKARDGVQAVARPNGHGAREAPVAGGSLATGEHRYTLALGNDVILARNLSAEGFLSGLRQLVGAAKDGTELLAVRAANLPMITKMRAEAPGLQSAKGEHYCDIVEGLMAKRLAKLTSGSGPARLEAPPPDRMSRIGSGPAVNKSYLSVAGEERVRSKVHLAFVASRPCLICEEIPAHAHHLTFAQPRGLAQKVSDVFTVPLCAVHHNELHQAQGEVAWWRTKGIEPLAVAAALWAENRRNAGEGV